MCASAGGGVFIVQVTLAFFGLAAPYESNFGFVLSWFSFSPFACGTATEKVAAESTFVCKCVLR